MLSLKFYAIFLRKPHKFAFNSPFFFFFFFFTLGSETLLGGQGGGGGEGRGRGKFHMYVGGV